MVAVDTKGEAKVGFQMVKSDSDLANTQRLDDPDQAYRFLTAAKASEDAVSQVDLKRLRRKIDWYIVPTMFLCYTMQFVDKVSLNVRRELANPCMRTFWLTFFGSTLRLWGYRWTSSCKVTTLPMLRQLSSSHIS